MTNAQRLYTNFIFWTRRRIEIAIGICKYGWIEIKDISFNRQNRDYMHCWFSANALWQTPYADKSSHAVQGPQQCPVSSADKWRTHTHTIISIAPPIPPTTLYPQKSIRVYAVFPFSRGASLDTSSNSISQENGITNKHRAIFRIHIRRHWIKIPADGSLQIFVCRAHQQYIYSIWSGHFLFLHSYCVRLQLPRRSRARARHSVLWGAAWWNYAKHTYLNKWQCGGHWMCARPGNVRVVGLSDNTIYTTRKNRGLGFMARRKEKFSNAFGCLFDSICTKKENRIYFWRVFAGWSRPQNLFPSCIYCIPYIASNIIHFSLGRARYIYKSNSNKAFSAVNNFSIQSKSSGLGRVWRIKMWYRWASHICVFSEMCVFLSFSFKGTLGLHNRLRANLCHGRRCVRSPSTDKRLLHIWTHPPSKI